MMKAPQNMMVSEREIREVGPHPHEWVTVGYDGTGASYQECSVCGTRRYEARHSGKPVRQDWLDGAPWEPSAGKKSAKDEGRQPTRSEQSIQDAEKSVQDAAPRRQSRS